MDWNFKLTCASIPESINSFQRFDVPRHVGDILEEKGQMKKLLMLLVAIGLILFVVGCPPKPTPAPPKPVQQVNPMPIPQPVQPSVARPEMQRSVGGPEHSGTVTPTPGTHPTAPGGGGTAPGGGGTKPGGGH